VGRLVKSGNSGGDDCTSAPRSLFAVVFVNVLCQVFARARSRGKVSTIKAKLISDEPVSVEHFVLFVVIHDLPNVLDSVFHDVSLIEVEIPIPFPAPKFGAGLGPG
jgi:hypothetical protein